MMNQLFIDGEFITKNLDYKDLVPAMEKTLATISNRVAGVVVQPVRTLLSVEEKNGMYYIMPAYSADGDVCSIKILSYYPDNASRRLPTRQSNIWLYNGSTGLLKATLEGQSITKMRTAAASAVATKYLAPVESRVHAILGAGGQAKSHLDAMASIIDFDEVRVWNHNYPKAYTFAETHGCKAFKSAEEAVQGADVITTVTVSKTPVLKKDWVKKGAHINAVGGHLPYRQEIDPALMTSAVVYVDSRESASKESGDVIKSGATVYAELGEVILGRMEARREETTIFNSLGMAVEDLVAAKLVYDEYQKALL